MAMEVMLQYINQLYTEPSLTNLSTYKKWNNSRPENNSLLPPYESTEMITFQDDQSELTVSAAHFGLATGLLAILLNSRLISFKAFKSDARVTACQQWAEALLPRLLLGVLCLLVTASLAPVVAVGFLVLAVYRRGARLLLAASNPRFGDLLEGTDAVWALEDDTSKSIINVLAFFEVAVVEGRRGAAPLLGTLRSLMRERLLGSADGCPKFWQHRRRSRLGYFYWERQEEVRVEDHVQYMTQEEEEDDGDLARPGEPDGRQDYYGMSESVLRGLVSELANSPLPYNNAASWEILVGRDPILEDLPETDPFQAMEEGNPAASGRLRRYPVLFRVHHAMGDGVALIRLLLETLADRGGPATPPPPAATLGYHDEAAPAHPRLDSIGLIKCSIGSAQDTATKVKRPTFLDLSPTSLENSKKKVLAEFLAQDNVDESVEIFVDKSPNILYTKLSSPPVESRMVNEDDDLEWEAILGSRTVEEVRSDPPRQIYCYPAQETVLTMDESIEMASEVMLQESGAAVYFERRVEVAGVEDTYKKVVDLCPPPPAERVLEQLLKEGEKEPPGGRCPSPMPPFKRDASRIERVLDKVVEARGRPCTPFAGSPTCSEESSVSITLDHDDALPLPPLLGRRPPYPGYEPTRNESPAPRIHRKKYPVRFQDLDQDQDSDDSPPTPRRADSPFLRDNSPLPYLSNKSGMKPNRHGPSSRSSTPLARYNSSTYSEPTDRAGSPFQINGIFDTQEKGSLNENRQRVNGRSQCNLDEGSLSRCSSPQSRSSLEQPQSSRGDLVPRCQSPFTRDGSPLPRNDNPIPRCNSPYMRNVTPIPRIDTPISRSNSPFLRSNTQKHKKDGRLTRDNAIPLQGKGIVMEKPKSQSQNSFSAKVGISQLYLTNSCHNPRANDVLCKSESNPTTESVSNCPFVEKTEGTESGSLPDPSRTANEHGNTMQNVPLTLTSSQQYTEKFIRGHFYSLDGEVINRSAVTPNCFIKLLDSINHRPSTIQHLSNYIKNTCALVLSPASLIHQTLVKAADVNPLHGPDLSGQKIVSWFFDSSSDNTENILGTIKRIKSRMSDAKFTDVFLSALSASLEGYFVRSGCDSWCIPEVVSVVIPVRMASDKEIEEAKAIRDEAKEETPSEEKKEEESTPRKIPAMENKFSVGLLSLPIAAAGSEGRPMKPLSPISRLREVCRHTTALRNSPDYHVNYWLMRVAATYLPLPLLAPLLNSTQSTMVLSNLLGPTKQLRLGGYLLKDIAFWVPNRGSTGVGVSVLSYSGRLQIGLVADRALIPCQQDANIIMDGIISELKCLDEITAPIKTHPLKV